MKDGIHPKYYPNAKVTCTCGNTFTVGSTLSEIQVEICSKCHPFFTGEMKFVDTQGRVEKFQAKQTQAQQYLQKKKTKKATKEKEEQRPQTLKEMLSHVKNQLTSSNN